MNAEQSIEQTNLLRNQDTRLFPFLNVYVLQKRMGKCDESDDKQIIIDYFVKKSNNSL